jgi:perosamine synthetase
VITRERTASKITAPKTNERYNFLMKRIPVAGPWITDLEIEYVAEAARSGWYDRAGEFQKRFEEAFAKKVGRRFAISVPHCTAAIHLGLHALGIAQGDEVIVPEITWIATAAPIQYVGATTVFADIDPQTWCLSEKSLATLLNKKTKAVITVDLYGGTPDYDAITALCEQAGVYLIEDAAQAVGAHCKGRPAGSFGIFSVFSFHGSKTLTTGEGGMFLTDDEALYRKALFLRDHGRPPGDKLFLNECVAFKYRMSATQAAMGLAQTERLEMIVEKKRKIFDWYSERLRHMEGIQLNAEPLDCRNAYWMTTLTWNDRFNIDKFGMMAALDKEAIDSRPFFAPLSALPAFKQSTQAAKARENNPHSMRISAKAINLPSALCLEEGDVQRVCETVERVLEASLA